MKKITVIAVITTAAILVAVALIAQPPSSTPETNAQAMRQEAFDAGLPAAFILPSQQDPRPAVLSARDDLIRRALEIQSDN